MFCQSHTQRSKKKKKKKGPGTKFLFGVWVFPSTHSHCLFTFNYYLFVYILFSFTFCAFMCACLFGCFFVSFTFPSFIEIAHIQLLRFPSRHFHVLAVSLNILVVLGATFIPFFCQPFFLVTFLNPATTSLLSSRPGGCPSQLPSCFTLRNGVRNKISACFVLPLFLSPLFASMPPRPRLSLACPFLLFKGYREFRKSLNF